ncbi:hemerythrin domain-containing protein [Aldersonia kunmingensis]|uniref:hemerythrin domain-containing protein n=1 Tax=Aldersonia kunmingensis TaxID=408066 RepID=UPI00082B7B68|nr:hemerythrin domain-containing protein [Aldersonia kunmingensis]
MERIDLLRLIHKALRHAILTVSLESGCVDYADTEATKRLDEAWMLLRENLAHHAHQENVIILPLLDARAPGETYKLTRDHDRIEKLEADMTGLLNRLDAETGTGHRLESRRALT